MKHLAENYEGKIQETAAGDLLGQLNPKAPLFQLAERIFWEQFKEVFTVLYCAQSRPANRKWLMVGLMLLKLVGKSERRTYYEGGT